MSLFGEVSYALISTNRRAIGFIVPDVVVEEQHHDELVITEFPVEDGAAITDHAYKRPAVLAMRCGFSNSSAGTEGYVQEIYEAFLALQNSRQPFAVTTGKRRYKNLLISSLDVVTDQRSESSLMVTIGLREIRLTSTKTSSSAGDATARAAADPANQASPEMTAGAVDLGTKQVQPYSPGPDSFAGVFSTGGNADFLGSGGSLGLGATGASAGFDTITFDGVTYNSGLADSESTAVPSNLPGIAGQFGSYGPTVFEPSPGAPF